MVSTDNIRPGLVIASKYKVVRKLGHGGTGVVLEAEHLQLGRRVALKLIDERYRGTPEVIARVVREARLTASLRHPSIVQVFDVELDPGWGPVIVMELLDGETLDRIIRRRNASVRRAVEIGRQLLAGLEVAHAAGVVHRDIKPSNVFLLREGNEREQVRIVDFGIAHAVSEASMTAVGSFLGTKGYASPEQRDDASKVDARSDIYSAGIVLAELITHRVVTVSGAAPHTALEAALAESGAPARLRSLILESVSDDPDRRPRDAASMRQEIEEIQATESLPDRVRDEGPVDAPGSTTQATVARPTVIPTTATWHTAMTQGRSVMMDDATALSRSRGAFVAQSIFAVGALVLVAVATQIDFGSISPPVTGTSGPDRDPPVDDADAAGTVERCRRWHLALATRQHEDGSFSGLAQAPPTGWDTAQQLYAWLASEDACGPIEPSRRLLAVRALDAFGTPQGWHGAEDVSEVASTPATSWALLTAAELAADASSERERMTSIADLLVAAQRSDGGFGSVMDVEESPSGYATVLATWGLAESHMVSPRPETELALQRAAAWIRASLRGRTGDDSLRLVAGLTEQALYVLLRLRALGLRDPADGELIGELARDLVARCGLQPDGACANAPSGIVDLASRRGSPTRVVTHWLPWVTLASGAIVADDDLGLDPVLREEMQRISVWSLRYASEMRVTLLVDTGYLHAEYLTAVGLRLRAQARRE